MQPLTLVALAAAIVVTAYEMRTTLEPVNCPQCPHCLEAARALAQQRDLGTSTHVGTASTATMMTIG